MNRLVLGLLLVWLFAALVVHFGLMRAAPPDACEIACGEQYTLCLLTLHQDPASPNPRAEHTCRMWTERECVKPCRRGR